MQDRRYMVTGAAGGIGRAITEVLLERGARVAMVDLVKEPVPGRKTNSCSCGSVRS